MQFFYGISMKKIIGFMLLTVLHSSLIATSAAKSPDPFTAKEEDAAFFKYIAYAGAGLATSLFGQQYCKLPTGGKAHIVSLAAVAFYFGNIVAGTATHNSRILRASFDSPLAHVGQFLTGFGLFGFTDF
jgi:hypothetical protein